MTLEPVELVVILSQLQVLAIPVVVSSIHLLSVCHLEFFCAPVVYAECCQAFSITLDRDSSRFWKGGLVVVVVIVVMVVMVVMEMVVVIMVGRKGLSTWLPNVRNPAGAPSPTTFLDRIFFNWD